MGALRTVADTRCVMTAGNRQSYLRNAVLQASPEQLHLMLFDGAIRFAMQGREAIERKDFEATYDRLTRAQKIVLEMQNGLRPEVNRELCERMSSLYNFIHRKLVSASINADVSDIDDAVKILKIERETWLMLLDKVNAERAGQGGSEIEPTAEPGSLSVQG